jgi:hypothetical protein
VKNGQYPGFTRAHAPYYWPDSTHLSFRDRNRVRLQFECLGIDGIDGIDGILYVAFKHSVNGTHSAPSIPSIPSTPKHFSENNGMDDWIQNPHIDALQFIV